MTKLKKAKLNFFFVTRTTGFQITVQMKITPSHEFIHYAYVYTRAKQFVVNWLVENKPCFKNEKELLSIIRHEWYEKPKGIGFTISALKNEIFVYKQIFSLW